MNKPAVLLAAAAVAALSSVPANGALTFEKTFAHANLCNPTTNDLTYGTYGVRNNTTANRSIYCGFEIRDYASPEYDEVALILRNYAGVTRTATCYLHSGYPLGGGYSTASISAILLADGGDPHEYLVTNLSRPVIGASLGVRCVLPPGVQLDFIRIYANDPSTT